MAGGIQLCVASMASLEEDPLELSPGEGKLAPMDMDRLSPPAALV